MLIFFAVSTTLVLHNKGIQLELPTGETSEELKDGIVISVDQNQKVFFNSELTQIDLITEKVKVKMQGESELIPIIISAHKETPYATIITLMDNVRKGGGTNVSLQVDKKVIDETNRKRN